MALQICPKCKGRSFTWFMNGKSALTYWSCFECDYEARENESDESVCVSCGKETKIKLKDKEKEYEWCSNCNETTDI